MSAPDIELFPGGEQSAFAGMMAELIRANLIDHPEKMRDFRAMRGRVALIADDAESAATLCFDRGKLSVYPGLYGIPDVTIRGTSTELIDLSRLPLHPRLRFLPDFRSPVAHSLARALYDGRLRIRGILRHAGLGLRLSRVFSIE